MWRLRSIRNDIPVPADIDAAVDIKMDLAKQGRELGLGGERREQDGAEAGRVDGGDGDDVAGAGHDGRGVDDERRHAGVVVLVVQLVGGERVALGRGVGWRWGLGGWVGGGCRGRGAPVGCGFEEELVVGVDDGVHRVEG